VDFEAFMVALARQASIAQVQTAIRASAGDGATKSVAEDVGLSRRQARRWLSARDYPRSKESEIRALASDEAVCAILLRTATQITYTGRVAVYYKNNAKRSEGTRAIPSLLSIPARVAAFLTSAAKSLEGAAQIAAAEDAFSDAVISGYEDGLEDTLGVLEYDHVVLSNSLPPTGPDTDEEGDQDDDGDDGPSGPPSDRPQDIDEPDDHETDDGDEDAGDDEYWQALEQELVDDTNEDADLDEYEPDTADDTTPDTVSVEPVSITSKALLAREVEPWLAHVEQTLGVVVRVEYKSVRGGRQKVTAWYIPHSPRN
jgi:hypothetical protein